MGERGKESEINKGKQANKIMILSGWWFTPRKYTQKSKYTSIGHKTIHSTTEVQSLTEGRLMWPGTKYQDKQFAV